MAPMRKSFVLFCLLLPMLSFGADPVRLDPPAGPGSLAPSLAPLEEGGLVLTWLERRDAGHVFRFSVFRDGEFGPAATIAEGEDWFANWADTPGLMVLPGGDWLAHWLVSSGSATYAYDVVMARSRDAGQSWGEPFSPHHDGTQSEHGFVSYFAEDDNRAGVVWLDGRETVGQTSPADDGAHDGHGEHGGGAMTLRTATVGGRGSKVGAKRLLDDRVCDCCRTASVMTPAGPVVVYRGRSEDEIRDHWVVRRVDGEWTEPELLHADGWRIGGCPVNGPAMIADGSEVVAAWFTMPDNEPQVRLARSTDAGEKFELIDTVGVGDALGRVDLVNVGDDFVLSWMGEQGAEAALELARYDGDGRRLWKRRIEGLENSRAAGFPRIGLSDDGQLLVVWTGRDDELGSMLRAALISVE